MPDETIVYGFVSVSATAKLEAVTLPALVAEFAGARSAASHRYRLRYSEGDAGGEATYAVKIQPAE